MKFLTDFLLGQKPRQEGNWGWLLVTCHREHIDNQNEREVRDCQDDARQQPGNFSLFLRQSSLSVNNKMPSYQAAVELESKSGERRF